MNKKILLCDIDEILWDMVPTWCATYNELPTTINHIYPHELTQWDISSMLDSTQTKFFYDILSSDSFWDRVIQDQDYVYFRNTYDLLQKLTQKYKVYIVTATSYYNKHKLDVFLNIFDFLTEDQLILIKDKWLLDADIIIDDRAETLQEFEKKGTRCVKINHTWNRWYDCENYNHFIFAATRLLEEV